MSSEVPRLEVVADELEALLKAEMPDSWVIANAERLGDTKVTKTALTYEQLDIMPTIRTAELPLHHVGVQFVLVLTVPETDATHAVPHITRELVHLLQLLDLSPLTYWDPAERERLTTGETAYRVPIAFLAHYTPEQE